jgi:hypothetical protein
LAKKEKAVEDDKRKAGALFIPAGLFIGMCIGFLTNNFVAYLFGGLGVGFALFAIIALLKK